VYGHNQSTRKTEKNISVRATKGRTQKSLPHERKERKTEWERYERGTGRPRSWPQRIGSIYQDDVSPTPKPPLAITQRNPTEVRRRRRVNVKSAQSEFNGRAEKLIEAPKRHKPNGFSKQSVSVHVSWLPPSPPPVVATPGTTARPLPALHEFRPLPEHAPTYERDLQNATTAVQTAPVFLPADGVHDCYHNAARPHHVPRPRHTSPAPQTASKGPTVGVAALATLACAQCARDKRTCNTSSYVDRRWASSASTSYSGPFDVCVHVRKPRRRRECISSLDVIALPCARLSDTLVSR